MARHLGRPARAWLDEASLPKLIGADGMALPADYLRLLLRIASQVKGPIWPDEARVVARTVSPSSCRALADALLSLFISRGASAAEKFCLVAALALGTDAAVAAVAKEIPKWPKQRRGKLAEFALEAMTVSEGELANVVLDGFARRLRTAHPKVAAAARRALGARAAAAGVTRLALVLERAPRFGFEGRILEVHAGRGAVRVGLDLDGGLQLRTSEGKRPKSLPKSAPEHVRSQVGLLAQVAKFVVREHEAFVEDALLGAQTIPARVWSRAFLQDGLRFVFASRQIWVALDAERTQTLRALEDGTLIDAAGKAVSLSEDAVIRLLHPTLDAPAEVSAWREHARAFRLETVVSQLDRPTYEVAPEQSGARFDPRFEGRRCVAFERVRAARRLGWRVDGLYAGADPSFSKTFVGGVTARLRVDGARDVALGLEFVDEDGRPIPLGAAPAPLYAQAVGEAEGLVGTS